MQIQNHHFHPHPYLQNFTCQTSNILRPPTHNFYFSTIFYIMEFVPPLEDVVKLPGQYTLLKPQLQLSSPPIRRSNSETHQSGGLVDQPANQGRDRRGSTPISREAPPWWKALVWSHYFQLLLLLPILNTITTTTPIYYSYYYF